MAAPDKATEIKAFITAVIAFGTALWGNLGWLIWILLICIAMDYVTGSWAALHKGEWSSSAARQGLWHKLGEITALAVAALCDIAIKVILQTAAAPIIADISLPETAFTGLVAVWYIFTELGSIIENVADLGAPIPKWLIKAIKKIREKADPEGTEEKSETEETKEEEKYE